MKRVRIFACAVCAVLLSSHPAASAAYYGFTVGVADAPRAPMIRMAREPHALLASDAMVYVVEDATLRFDGDLFHYGQYWFAYTRGYWYRARSHRGPYSVIEVHKVPRAIIGVPRKLWKHHPLAMAPAKATSAGSVAQGKSSAPARAQKRPPHADRAKRMGPPAPRSSRMSGPLAMAERSSANAPAAPGTQRSPRGSAR